MPKKYEIISKTGNLIGRIQPESTPSSRRSELGIEGIWLIPILTGFLWVASWLVGTFFVKLFKNLLVDGLRSMEVALSLVGPISGADHWAIGKWFATIVAAFYFVYMEVKWFKDPENRETMWGLILLVAFIFGLIFVSKYVFSR